LPATDSCHVAGNRSGSRGDVEARGDTYRSGECRDWVKVKTASERGANRERWRLFERAKERSPKTTNTSGSLFATEQTSLSSVVWVTGLCA
jgi:hypothetical protein